jgi:hypothetical protein
MMIPLSHTTTTFVIHHLLDPFAIMSKVIESLQREVCGFLSAQKYSQVIVTSQELELAVSTGSLCKPHSHSHMLRLFLGMGCRQKNLQGIMMLEWRR